MDLFVVREGKAFPSVHALLIKPFKTMWEMDTDPAKGEAIRMFTFIELSCSPKKSNPYFGYGEEVRHLKLKEAIYDDPHYQLDPIVMDGIIKYEELLTNSSPSYAVLKSALEGAAKFQNIIENMDLHERTRGGTAVYKPKDITNALNDLPNMVKNIETTRQKVSEELFQETKTRKDREINYFEE